MKRVALKFCGGCDPSYDRVEYWKSIRSAAGERIGWRRIDEGGFEAVFVINGCQRECALDTLKNVSEVKVVSVRDNTLTSEEILEKILAD